MRHGGIFDQVGYGFHRYSTDEKWLLPHFEKMLYDQALLAIAYLEAYQATGKPLFKQAVHEIFTYVLRDMKAPEGGFYSAEDADSEGIEGKFYVWSLSEIKEVLNPEETDFIRDLYNIKSDGNFHDEASGAKTGENIFYRNNTFSSIGGNSTQDQNDISSKHDEIREKLFTLREKRVHPHKDDKILTDWNGLMFGALALGGRILANKTYIEAAEKGAHFVLSSLYQKGKGRLKHRYRDGETAIDGMLCDYAYVVWGLLELYAASFKPEILEQAIQLNRKFWNRLFS